MSKSDKALDNLKQSIRTLLLSNRLSDWAEQYVGLGRTKLDVMIDDVKALEAKLTNAMKVNQILAKKVEEHTGTCPSDMHDWEHPETCEGHCDNDIAACWLLWAEDGGVTNEPI